MWADERIFNVLRRCVGPDLGMTSVEIAHEVGMSNREVRRQIAKHHPEWVRKLRAMLLCVPGKGYYFATEAEAIEREQLCKLRLKQQADSRLKILQQLMRETGFGGLIENSKPKTQNSDRRAA